MTPMLKALVGVAMISFVAGGCSDPAGRASAPSPSASTSIVSPSATDLGASGWLTAIPSGLRLSGHSQAYATRLYEYVCLDPARRLRNARLTDQRASIHPDGSGGTVIERLAVYADEATATEALDDLRAEVRQCGDTRDESGAKLDWRLVRAQAVPQVAEAWHLYVLRDPADRGAFVSLARLGNAIYFTDHRGTVPLTRASASTTEAGAGARRLRAFRPTLCRFAAAPGDCSSS